MMDMMKGGCKIDFCRMFDFDKELPSQQSQSHEPIDDGCGSAIGRWFDKRVLMVKILIFYSKVKVSKMD